MSDEFLQGVGCYERYGSRDENPYDEDTVEWFSWDIGYSEAKNGYYSSEEGWSKQ